MHDVLVWHMKIEIALDFHVFEVQGFDILIGHPVEKLFLDVSTLGKLEVSLGGRSYTLPIGQTKNSLAEPAPQEEPFEEVLAVMPDDTSKPSLERDAELFIQEEDDLEENLELPIHEKPTWPPIEFVDAKINTLESEGKCSPSSEKSTKCASQFDLQLTRKR